MPQRWFSKIKYIRRQRYSSIVFFLTLFFWFAFFSGYNNIHQIIQNESQLDIFSNNLKILGLYTRAFNKWLGTFVLDVDQVVQSYKRGENWFETQRDSIDHAREYIYQHPNLISDRWFKRYESLLSLLANLYPYREEIYQLLWDQKATNYLAILQNVGEKRPNWWFFGSFAFTSIQKAQVADLGIIDTYFPNHIAPNTFLQVPPWSEKHFESKQIWFVAANKFWFTDMDWSNIKQLYEKIFNEDYQQQKVTWSAYEPLQQTLFHKYIKWVIFLRTDMFENYIDWFSQQVRARQFVNASIDLIRWEERSHKKEIYIEEVNEYFSKNQFMIIKTIINNFEDILDNNYINIYLSNVSPQLNKHLQDIWLQTNYQSDKIYARDTNNAFNKADRFITKEIIINNPNQQLIKTNKDIIDIKQLEPGNYKMTIYYHFNVSPAYKIFIKQLQAQYHITLTPREEGILALWPSYDNITRATKSIIYFPKQRTIQNIQGDIYEINNLDTWFAKAISYKSHMTEENQTKMLELEIVIPSKS